MGVYIKGMKMPKTCNDCLINCKHSLLYVGVTDKRHPDCPLTEISLDKEQMEIVNKMLKERG